MRYNKTKVKGERAEGSERNLRRRLMAHSTTTDWSISLVLILSPPAAVKGERQKTVSKREMGCGTPQKGVIVNWTLRTMLTQTGRPPL